MVGGLRRGSRASDGEEVVGGAQLAGGVALEGEERVVVRHAMPSSMMRIMRLPPASTSTRIVFAPASSAFSRSSLTTEAGRSTTSPAAMRFADSFGRMRMRLINSIPISRS